jgi:Ca2+-binding EF-hand superfamily protein
VKLGIGLIGAWALGAAVMFACSGTAQRDGTASTDLATMVAALSVNSAGSDATWSEATDPEPAHVPACGFEHIVSKVIAHYDTNGDGTLSADERSRMDGDFGDHDGDDQGDDKRADAGPVGAGGGGDAGPPVVKGHPGGHGRVATLISLYDTNDDGTLDATELAQLKSDIEARCQARLDKLIAEFDVNGDGKLDDTEWKAVEVALHARFEENLAAVVAQFDANGDGKLSLDEAKSARTAAEQERADAEAQFSSKGDGKLDDDGDRQRFRDHGRECMRDDKPMMGDGGHGSGSAGTGGGSGGHISIGVHDGSGAAAGAGGSAGETDSSN